MDVDAVVPGGLQICAGEIGQLRPPLDRVDFGGELRQHRRLVSGPRPDVEDVLVTLEGEGLADLRDHVRLRDRLPASDRQGRIVVRAAAQGLGDEQLSRHGFHGLEDALVGDVPAPELPLDHLPAKPGGLRRRV